MNNENLEPKSPAQRITDVEAPLAHLQKINHELSAVIFEQQKQITAMEKQISQLQARLGDIEF